ncbi:MAG TPA: KpsF/GutQ family sugar-phosphate isomerase [Fontimonas sp.]
MDAEKLKALGRRALEIERDAVAALIGRVDDRFADACRIMLACKGRLVVIGMGKSGHIGSKLAATFASTGTPAFFVHPGEASHGDLGMVTRQDVVLALSYSGETNEMITLLPLLKRMAVPLIAMTGKPGSTLATAAEVHIDVSVALEACPLNLAPTSSTTATLAMGDALAVALLEARGFTPEDFALSHPGGSLGRRLLLKIADVMHSGERLPVVGTDATLREALLEMSRKGLGLAVITTAANEVAGVFTDGDLRRVLDQNIDVRSAKIADVMTPGGKAIGAGQLAAEAVALMEKHKITSVLVKDDRQQLIGVVHMHDLLRAGVV